MVILLYGPGCGIGAEMMKGRPQAAAREDLSMTILRSPRDLLGLYDGLLPGTRRPPTAVIIKYHRFFELKSTRYLLL